MAERKDLVELLKKIPQDKAEVFCAFMEGRASLGWFLETQCGFKKEEANKLKLDLRRFFEGLRRQEYAMGLRSVKLTGWVDYVKESHVKS